MLKLLAALFLLPSAYADVSVPRAKQYAYTIYDVATNGGASVPHNLGLYLEEGSVITDAWVYINTAFTDSGTGSLALQCAGTRDIMAYLDPTIYAKDSVIGRQLQPVASGAFNTSFIPQAPDTATVMNFQNGSIPSKCAVTAVVRGDSGFVPLTAGKMTVILEYFKLY